MSPEARGRVGVAAAALGAALAGALAHLETLSYWFTASDTVPFVEVGRRAVRGDPASVFAEPMLAGTRFVEFALFYRPLATLSYAGDYALWGLDPAGYHLTNVLLHAVAAGVTTVGLVVVTRRLAAGALGGFLFAVHPLTAEVVPAASRRHDVLLTIFLVAALALFVRHRRESERWLPLAGSLALYSLALLSKEPALLFPGLVVAWVALERDSRRPWRRVALRAGGWAALPYVAVTAGYVVLRIAVLGSFGGYTGRPIRAPAEAVVVVVEYLLSLGYPHGVASYGSLPGAGPGWRLVVAAMGVLAAVVLVGAGLRLRGRERSGAALAALACAAALVAIPVAVALEPAVPALLQRYGRPTILWAYPRPASPVVGLLLVGAVVAGAAWAALDRPASLAAADRRTLLFFAAWLAGPVVLFLPSGEFSFRSGYFSLVPAMGAVALLLVVGAGGVREAVVRRRRRARPADATDGGAPGGIATADVAAVAVALLLVVPLAATSPLVHGYDGWETSGRVNEATLTGVHEAVEGSPDGTPVLVKGMLRIVADRGCAFPQAKTMQFARPGTVESWLRIHGEDRNVSSLNDSVLPGPPDRITVEGEHRSGVVVADVDYGGHASEGCLRTPWKRY